MKKLNLILSCFLAVFLVNGAAHAQIARTSVTLNDESVLPSNLTAVPSIAVGTVIPWPSTGWPLDANDWLECNGQIIPPDPKYDQLRALVGAYTPDYTDQFLRGGVAGKVGTTAQDSIKSHSVDVPGQIAAVTGTAAPHSFGYQGTGEADSAVITSAPNSTVGLTSYNNTHFQSGGMTSGGAVTGQADVQAVTGSYSGGSETAPKHTYVRYLIRAIQ